MEFFGVIFLSIIFNICHGEKPMSSCSNDKPFKTMNNSCADFNEICVKKDLECTNFQNICHQCPPSNYSLLMFLDILNLKDRIEKKADQIDRIEKKADQIGRILNFLWFTVFVISITLICVILENRFKLLTKFCTLCTVKFCTPCLKTDCGSRYTILQSRKAIRENTKFETIENLLGLLIDSKLNEAIKRIEKLLVIPTNSIRFHIDGTHIPIELYVHRNENVIQVKKRICEKWHPEKSFDCKIMKLKCNGVHLDDNQNFIESIDSINDIIICEMDKRINDKDICILRLQGCTCSTELIQIQNNKTISELRTIISKLNNFTTNICLIDMKTGKELDYNKTVQQSNLIDEDCIKVIMGKILVKSMFGDDCFTIEYSNTDLIITLKDQLVTKYSCESENLVLFCNNIILDDNKCISYYGISTYSEVTFCILKKWSDVETIHNAMEKEGFCHLFKGKYITTKKDILVKRYTLKSKIVLKENKAILEELKICQTTKSHERFEQLIEIFKDEKFLYVSIENVDKGSIVMFLRKFWRLEETEIVTWSKQILEGLKYLHSKNIIHGNLNPSNILVDASRNLKLSSFNLSANFNHYEESVIDVELFPLRYLSPEILNDEPFTTLTDVWSFGAVLIYVITENSPYSGLGECDAAIEIKSINKIKYKELDPKISNGLRDFMNACLVKNLEERPNVDKLLIHEFIINSK